MSAHSALRRLSHPDLLALSRRGEKLVMLTCYDASFAQMLDAAGVEILLVGDSLGNVVQGQTSTLPVTLAHMVYHTEAVVRGSTRAMVVTDMPFGTSQITPKDTYRNAVPLMAAGAQMVKIEGGEEMAATVDFLTHRGIPVCGHIGLTPQSVHQFGGFRVQGKDAAGAAKLLADARAIAQAGASLIVLEAVPAELAAEVTRAIPVPTIGIGAGKDTSGQVLVIYDLLHIGAPEAKRPRFVKNFMANAASPQEAVAAYVAEVKQGLFPGPEHAY